MSRIIATIEPFLTDFCEDFIVSDTLPGQRIPTTITTALVGAALHRDALFRGTSGAGG